MNKNIINCISLSRILFGLFFAYIALFDLDKLDLLFVFFITALSDFSDGKLAKKYDLESDFGAKLDVICDFIFIMVSAFAVALIGLIPFWFLFVIALKLLEFFISSHFQKELYYDNFGHAVALMFYVLPILVVFINFKTINLALCIFISLCALISSALRINHIMCD